MAFKDEIFELFSWLPAKALYKFSTISKPYLDLLSENYFIEKQCQNMLLKPDNYGFFLHEDNWLSNKAHHLQLATLSESKSKPKPELTITSSTSMGIPCKSLEFLLRKGRILSSSNGLILGRTIGSKPIKLFLCNPVTRTWFPIKLPTKDLAKRSTCDIDLNVVLITYFKFGDEKEIKFPLDYKILLFNLDTSKDWSSEYIVYVFNKGKWVMEKQKLNTGSRDLNFKGAVNCQDGLYFISDCRNYLQPITDRKYWPYILCYDLRSGSSRTVPIPFEAGEYFMNSSVQTFGHCNMQIFGWKRVDQDKEGFSCYKSILLVQSMLSKFAIWVLEDTKDPKTWRLIDEKYIQDDLGIKDSITNKLNFTVTGKMLIFATDNYVYSYCFLGKNFGDVQYICTHSCSTSGKVLFELCSNTLRPCIKDSSRSPYLIR